MPAQRRQISKLAGFVAQLLGIVFAKVALAAAYAARMSVDGCSLDTASSVTSLGLQPGALTSGSNLGVYLCEVLGDVRHGLVRLCRSKARRFHRSWLWPLTNWRTTGSSVLRNSSGVPSR